MYYNIRILDGNFIIYDERNRKPVVLNDPNVTFDSLKKEILQSIENQVFPIKLRSLIYDSLATISGYRTKNACKTVLDQEANDPVFQELCSWVLSLDSYKELTKTSRRLYTNVDEFVISDINGVILVIPNDQIDLEKIKNKYDFSTCEKSGTRKPRVKTLLKDILSQEFDVTYCTLNYCNPIIAELFQKISIQNRKKEIMFKDGKILIRIDSEIFEPADYITMDALKLEMIKFCQNNPNEVTKSKVIYGSLESLSGLKAVKYYPKYETIYIGANKVKKEVIVGEDPLHKELCDYLDTLPIFQENLKKRVNLSKSRLQSKKEQQALTKEQRFVDQNYSYHGTYIPRRTYKY